MIPDSPRPLGTEGMKLWQRIWGMEKPWISRTIDLDHVALLCESMDERVALRFAVLRGDEWRARVALRALDGQIADLMSALGLNPAERAKLNTPREEAGGSLVDLRLARQRNTAAGDTAAS